MQLRLHGHIVAQAMIINAYAGGPFWCYRLSIKAWTTMSQKLPADSWLAKVLGHTMFQNEVQPGKSESL